jgi:hypothetical protein
MWCTQEHFGVNPRKFCPLGLGFGRKNLSLSLWTSTYQHSIDMWLVWLYSLAALRVLGDFGGFLALNSTEFLASWHRDPPSHDMVENIGPQWYSKGKPL